MTPWTAECQASLSITNSWSTPKPMSIESVMPIQPSHPLSSPSPPALNLSQHQGLFQWVSCLHQVAKVLEFQLQHSPTNEHTGLISFRMDLVKSLNWVICCVIINSVRAWRKKYFMWLRLRNVERKKKRHLSSSLRVPDPHILKSPSPLIKLPGKWLSQFSLCWKDVHAISLF